jgi:hypothetical protein
MQFVQQVRKFWVVVVTDQFSAATFHILPLFPVGTGGSVSGMTTTPARPTPLPYVPESIKRAQIA